MTHLRHIPLGYGGEFDVISAALQRWGPLARGVGDDGAVMDIPAGERLVLSVDTAVDGVHFRKGWLSPEEIGYRATAAALSDLAAMAATPLGVAIAMTLPDSWRPEFLKLCDGIGGAVKLADAVIIGGDLTRGTELSITLTVVGHAATPLSRRGARPGDALYVTGRLGGPLLALRAFGRGGSPGPDCRARFGHPVPRFAEARWLAEHGATAGLDISDGLASDVAHLAAAGGVRVVLDLEALPLFSAASPEEAVRSGEEYELVVSAPPTLDIDAFVAEHQLPLTRIGEVLPEQAGVPSVEGRVRGRTVKVARGWDHFGAP